MKLVLLHRVSHVETHRWQLSRERERKTEEVKAKIIMVQKLLEEDRERRKQKRKASEALDTLQLTMGL